VTRWESRRRRSSSHGVTPPCPDGSCELGNAPADQAAWDLGDPPAQAMVEVIRDFAGLTAFEGEWEALHRADPWASVFTSSAWVRGRLAGISDPWCVLVARHGAGQPALGVLPLRRLPSSPMEQIPWAAEDEVPSMEGEAVRGLGMAGSPLADYTGFVCSPRHETPALAALAKHIQRNLDWRYLVLLDVLDPRLDAFLSHFPEPEFRIERRPSTPCPYLTLPPSWEAYLDKGPRPRLRREIRHDLRAMEGLGGFRRTSIQEGGQRQIEILLDLWQGRWGFLPEAQLAQYRSILVSCLASGCLWLDILWDRDHPLAGLLAFLDRGQRSFGFYLTGFDRRYARLSPGTVVVAHAIREAIGNGYRVFDFLRGDEPYKFAFGAEVRHTRHVTVVRRTTPPPRGAR